MQDDATTGGSLLDQRLEIETPERVVITHDLAGIGSRFAAGTIDACFLIIPWCGAVCVLAAMMPMSMRGGEPKPEELQALGMATVGVCYAIFWLYFLLFETFGGGRTPGKRILKLRVMSVHGGPAPASAVVLRNVVRVVDSIPTLILPVLGGIVMFTTKRAQRIGDLVAGTVVVRERIEALRLPSRGGAGGAKTASATNSFFLPLPGMLVYGSVPREQPNPEFLAGAAGASANASASVDELTATEIAEVDRFLVRRGELNNVSRTAIAAQICGRLRDRYALPPGDAEKILGLLGARRTPQQVRDLAGPAFARQPSAGASPPTPPAPAGSDATEAAEPSSASDTPDGDAKWARPTPPPSPSSPSPPGDVGP
ncbi:MAG: RDD family protein [Planctomycetes bacterium]|nr:RDD family protein [Planctomycetota bacterium]